MKHMATKLFLYLLLAGIANIAYGVQVEPAIHDIALGMDMEEVAQRFEERYRVPLVDADMFAPPSTQSALVPKDGVRIIYMGYLASPFFLFDQGELTASILEMDTEGASARMLGKRMCTDILQRAQTAYGAQTDGKVMVADGGAYGYFDYPIKEGVRDDAEMFRLLEQKGHVRVMAYFGNAEVTISRHNTAGVEDAPYAITLSIKPRALVDTMTRTYGTEPYRGVHGAFKQGALGNKNEGRLQPKSFADIPFGLSAAECAKRLEEEHGVVPVVADVPAGGGVSTDTLVSGRLHVPYGGLTYMDKPIAANFIFRGDALQAVTLSFTDLLYEEKASTEADMRSKREAAQGMFFAISQKLAESMLPPQDAALTIYRNKEMTDTWSYHYPMQAGMHDEAAIREILSREDAISMAEVYGNVRLGYFSRWTRQDGSFSGFDSVTLEFSGTAPQVGMHPFRGADGDYFAEQSPYAKVHSPHVQVDALALSAEGDTFAPFGLRLGDTIIKARAQLYSAYGIVLQSRGGVSEMALEEEYAVTLESSRRQTTSLGEMPILLQLSFRQNALQSIRISIGDTGRVTLPSTDADNTRRIAQALDTFFAMSDMLDDYAAPMTDAGLQISGGQRAGMFNYPMREGARDTDTLSRIFREESANVAIYEYFGNVTLAVEKHSFPDGDEVSCPVTLRFDSVPQRFDSGKAFLGKDGAYGALPHMKEKD